jgi:hypothetical protein
LKNHNCEGYEVMFQGVEKPSEQFFCILGIEKSGLDEITIQVLSK